MNTLWQDLRFGARMLLKKPGFTLIAVLTLALGIGANTAIFSLIDKLLLQTLPVPRPERLANLVSESLNPKIRLGNYSWLEYTDYRDRNEVFSDLIAWGARSVDLGVGQDVEKVACELVSSNYFSGLGVPLLAGRAFTDDENRAPGAQAVAVLSYALWQQRFGGNRSLIGQTIGLNQTTFTVIGIAPAGFRGLNLDRPADVWTPVMMHPQLMQLKAGNDWTSERRHQWLDLMGRLKPGITLEQASASMDALSRRIRDANMPVKDRSLPFNEQRMFLESGMQGDSRLREKLGDPLKYLMLTVGMILLIACANVANLLLARATARRKEIAVRLALGAGRARLARQLLTESLLLAFAGGLAGMLLAPWLIDLLLAFEPDALNVRDSLTQVMDWRMFGFTIAVSLLTGVLFGLAPAWQSTRVDLLPALKDEGAAQSQRDRFFSPRNLLVAGQVALALMVLIGAGLSLRTLGKLFAIDPGFKAENILMVDVNLPESRYDAVRGQALALSLSERLRALPGVAGLSAADYTPLSGNVGISSLLIEGQPGQPENLPTSFCAAVGPGYHELMRIGISAGRGFTEEDRTGAPGVVIVSEAFARKYFPNENAVGRRFSVGPGNPWLEIVGVARDVRTIMMLEETDTFFYRALAQQEFDGSQRLLLRTAGDPDALRAAVRQTLQSLDPTLALSKMTALSSDLRKSISPYRAGTALTTVFGAVALALAALGLYGVMSYAVQQRTREIGIRIALGAQPADVLRLIVGRGMAVALLGIAAGSLGAIALARLIEHLLYQVSATDPMTFAGVALLLALVALAACWIPARRAAKVDPMVTLRCE